MENVAENLDRVRAQISEATKKSGRSADDVELVAISKTHEAEKELGCGLPTTLDNFGARNTDKLLLSYGPVCQHLIKASSQNAQWQDPEIWA